MGSNLCFSIRLQLFHLPCYISPEFSTFSSWQRRFLSRNLLAWNRCGLSSHLCKTSEKLLLPLGQFCKYMGLSCGFEYKPEQGHNMHANPYPRGVPEKKHFTSDIPLSYMFPLASSLCPEQYCCFIQADREIRGLSCPFFSVLHPKFLI